MNLEVKIFTAEEYDELKQKEKESIVSELRLILATAQLVAVEQGDMYKIIKFPKVQSVVNEDEEDALELYVSKDELQQFIFLQGL